MDLAPLIKIFNTDDKIYFAKDGTVSRSGQDVAAPVYAGFVSLGDPAVTKIVTSDFRYYVINPLTKWAPEGSLRQAANVSAFRSWVFEFDKAPLPEQLQAIRKLKSKLPLAMVTFSGSKSYHVIVSLQDTAPWKPHTADGVSQYRAFWKAIAGLIKEVTGLDADPSCKDPCRLSRTPNAVRLTVNASGHEVLVKQYALVEEGVGRVVSFQDLQALVSPWFQPVTEAKVAPAFSGDLRAFEALLSKNEYKYLRNEFEYPQLWAASENMYPEIFRRVLWAIDATGVSESVLSAFLQKKVFPAIIAKGYTRDLTLPVANAYLWKGLR